MYKERGGGEWLPTAQICGMEHGEEAKEVRGHQVMSVSVPIGRAVCLNFRLGTVMPVKVGNQGNAQETSKNFL